MIASDCEVMCPPLCSCSGGWGVHLCIRSLRIRSGFRQSRRPGNVAGALQTMAACVGGAKRQRGEIWWGLASPDGCVMRMRGDGHAPRVLYVVQGGGGAEHLLGPTASSQVAHDAAQMRPASPPHT